MKIDHHTDDLVDARLSAIAESLFGPSSDTLAAVALGGKAILSGLPQPLRERLSGPRYQRQLDVLRATLSDSAMVDQTPWLGAAAVSEGPFARGEVRIVEGVDLNDPECERRYTEPVLVLLERTVAQHPDEPPSSARVWLAWTVSPHAGFAGYWDSLLQGSGVPACCAMVQVWNPVRVAESQLGRCSYRLSAEQMQDVEAVWLEFISGVEEPDESDGTMSAGIRSTVHDQQVVTGTPSTGADDPRFLFQRFYVLVREALVAATNRALRVSTVSAIPGTAANPEVGAGAQVDRWVDSLKTYSNLLQRLTIRGLHDRNLRKPEPEREGEMRADRAGGANAGELEVIRASYFAKDRELFVDGLRDLLARAPVQFQFFVGLQLGTAAATDAPEELVPIEHVAVAGPAGAFVLTTELPVAVKVLAGKVNLEVQVRADGQGRHLVIGILRAAG